MKHAVCVYTRACATRRALSLSLKHIQAREEIRDHSWVRLLITSCIQRFYLRAAISDCLLIGFIRATETLRKN